MWYSIIYTQGAIQQSKLQLPKGLVQKLIMSIEFKKFQNITLWHMKTFDKTYIRLLDHFLGREKHLSFFSEQSLYSIPKFNS